MREVLKREMLEAAMEISQASNRELIQHLTSHDIRFQLVKSFAIRQYFHCQRHCSRQHRLLQMSIVLLKGKWGFLLCDWLGPSYSLMGL
jgi:hypothetical protein